MRKNNVGTLLVILGLCCVTNKAKAADGQNPAPLFNSDIFSLSKKKEDAFDAPSATYIISSEDIRRSGLTSIPELLRLVPGVQVTKANNNTWDISVRGYNAQYSNKLLVMIDGRTIYTTLFSGVFWDEQDYPLEDIERIEVVKGPGGTIWGANAVNGVVNIITKSASLTQGGYVSGLAGNQDTIGEARYGGKIGSDDYYRVYAKRTYRNSSEITKVNNKNASNDDSFRSSHAGFRYDIKSVPGSDISVASDVSDLEAKNYFPTLNVNNLQENNRDSTHANLILNWDKTLSKKSNLTLQTYFDYTKFDMTILKMDSKVYDIDLQYFYNLNKRNQLISGLGYRRVDDALTEYALTTPGASAGVIPLNYTPDQQNNNTYSAFLQDKIGIIIDKLYLTIGSKFEHNDYTDYEYQPNAKLTYFPSENQTIWSSVSRAIRTPTRGERGLVLRGASGAIANQGSHQYQAENEIAYELGYRIKPTRTTLFDIALFYNDYDKLRTFEGSSVVANNLAYGISKGLEISAKWQATKDWRLEAGYDYLDMNIKVYPQSTNATSIFRVNGQSPRNQFNFRSNYNITPKIEFDNMVYYVDSLPGSFSTANTSSTTVPSYIRFDTRIAYLPVKNVELSLVGQNLTDKRHQEFKDALYNNQTEIGRTFYFKVLYGF